MLFGRLPFESKTVKELKPLIKMADKLVNEENFFPNKEISIYSRDLIKKCLKLEERERISWQ